ncbi:MAG: hypothetical protein ILO68_04650, partial [Clostridia bacterium]|nr:hypothetical protein [Clostridia bacterium]
FKQIPEPSITRFAIELLLPAGDGGLENRRLYYRDEYSDGTVKCCIPGENGELTETDYDTYQAFRTAFFASNHQQGRDLTFVTGNESEAVARSLRKAEG